MTGHDVGPLLFGTIAAMFAVVALLLRLIFLDLDHTDGTPPAPHVVVWTPATYGPPAG